MSRSKNVTYFFSIRQKKAQPWNKNMSFLVLPKWDAIETRIMWEELVLSRGRGIVSQN